MDLFTTYMLWSFFATIPHCLGLEFPKESQARTVKNIARVTSHQTPTKLDDYHLQSKGMSQMHIYRASVYGYVCNLCYLFWTNVCYNNDDETGMSSVPAPLATKIYYSQRNQRLRSAISHMYYRSSYTQHDNGLSNMEISDCYHHNNIDDQRDKVCDKLIRYELLENGLFQKWITIFLA